MAKIGRTLGGVIAIAGGGVYTYLFINYLLGLLSPLPQWVQFFYTLTVCLLAIIGGVLLLLDRTVGGVLAILAGGMVIIGLISVVPVYFVVDTAFMIAGGIIGLAVGAEV